MVGLNTYNVIKRVIWSCVLDRSRDECAKKPEINLHLLQGLLLEVRMELAVEDFMYRSGTYSFDPSYKVTNIYDETGFDDYSVNHDHPAL